MVAIRDVRLQSDHRLCGRISDDTGRPLSGYTVELRQGRRVVARIITDVRGEYEVAEMSGGVYQVIVGGRTIVVRVWATGSAPPESASQLDLTVSRDVVRGQDEVIERFGLDGEGGLDPFELTLLASSVTSLTLSAIMLSKINDIEDNVDQLVITNGSSPPASP